MPERDAIPAQAGPGIGVALRADGGGIDLVVAAIRDDNAPADLVVVDHGSSVEVRAARGLQVTAGTLHWHLGRRFGTADLQAMILWTDGELVTTGDRVTITAVPGGAGRRSPLRTGTRRT